MADHARTQAKSAGLTRYFTGQPCAHGHVTERMVSSGACVECKRSRTAEWTERNSEKVREQGKAWASNNREKSRDKSTKWRTANRIKHNGSQSRYRAANLEKETARQQKWRNENQDKMRALNAKWYRENPHKAAARSARRRGRIISATPAWEIEFTDFAMEEASELSRARAAVTGFPWHVDHMLPLQARRVSGLHVWSNLQVIPEWMNLQKNNRLRLILPGEWISFA